MRLGTSLVLIAIGAILRFAISVTAKGFSIHTIGLILLIVGIVGLILSLLWMSIWADRRRGAATVGRRDDLVERDSDLR